MIALLVHEINVQELLRLHCILCPVLYSDMLLMRDSFTDDAHSYYNHN